jgi:uncharacterized membrane protein YuzA (DUF378 family)
MKFLKAVAAVLVTIGAVNWGLVGASRVSLVDRIFGRDSSISRIIYGLVGVAGLYHITRVKREVVA